MADRYVPRENDDPFHLNRFVTAQEGIYGNAIAEITSGQKQSHWMWFVFPQFEGLGLSPTSRRYAIKSVAEAKAYLSHPVLGPRLIECVETLLGLEGRTAYAIFGSPDNMKLRSCATLFAHISPAGSPFARLLSKYFEGESDPQTKQLLSKCEP